MKKLLGRSVYSNALAIFFLATVVLLGIMIALTQSVILREFSATEKRVMVLRLQQFGSMLLREVKPLDKTVSQLARRPDLEIYLQSKPPRSHPPNLIADLDSHSLVDFLAVYTPEGQSVLFELRDPSLRSKIGETDTLAAQFLSAEATSEARTSEVMSGFVLLNDRLVAIATTPIYRSNGESSGPLGYLVCGKILDQEALAFLESIFGAQIEFNPFRNLEVSAPGNEHILRMLTSNEIAVITDDTGKLTGYMFIRSPNRSPLGLLKFMQPQNLLDQGKHASRLFLIAISISGGVLVLVVWFLLDRTILRRIRSLTKKLEQEKKSGRLPVKLNFEGEDELSELAQSIEDLARLLENTQSQYRNVVEDQTDMICRFDARFNLTFANDVFRKAFRLESATLESQRLDLLLDPPNRTEFLTYYERLSPDRPLSTSVHQLHPDEPPECWLRTTLRKSFSADGTATGGQWVSSDITPQIAAQQLMLESERRFRRLFETASDGILLVEGRHLKISDINPSLGRLLDLDAHDILGQEVRHIAAFRACLRVIRRFESPEEAPAPSESSKTQTRILKANGGELFIELSCTSYQWQNERFYQFNFHDVTERVRGEQALRNLSSRLLKSQDDERRKIARELHDSTAQNLSALEMNVTLLETSLPNPNDKIRRLLEETRRLSSDCSQEIRNISYLLHPPLIDEVGLAFAIKWFAAGYSQRTGIGVTVEISPDLPRLDREIEMPLFRIVQEALTNIYRHSGADSAELTLTREDGDVLCLSITDNGHGFRVDSKSIDPDEEAFTQIGVGLAGMRERTVELQGQFTIESSPEGVSIVIVIPLAHGKIHSENSDRG